WARNVPRAAWRCCRSPACASRGRSTWYAARAGATGRPSKRSAASCGSWLPASPARPVSRAVNSTAVGCKGLPRLLPAIGHQDLQVFLPGRRDGADVKWLRASLRTTGFPQQVCYTGPELAPPLALGLGQFGQRLRLAHASEIGVLLPVLQCF